MDKTTSSFERELVAGAGPCPAGLKEAGEVTAEIRFAKWADMATLVVADDLMGKLCAALGLPPGAPVRRLVVDMAMDDVTTVTIEALAQHTAELEAALTEAASKSVIVVKSVHACEVCGEVGCEPTPDADPPAIVE